MFSDTCDAISTEELVEGALRRKGITYMRTNRPETPILYAPNEKFPIGGSKIFHSLVLSSPRRRGSVLVSGKKTDPRVKPEDDKEVVTVVAAGITLFEALKAQKELAEEGMGIRVIDCYSVKPIDTETLVKAARETKAIIVVEDHYPEGGLGEAVKSALFDSDSSDSGNPTYSRDRVIHLSVTKTPRSGKPAELLAYEEIDANAIIKTVKNIV
jgi:transketolase